MDELCDLCVKPRIGRWKEYADQAWFDKHEARCEQVLADFFGDGRPAKQGIDRRGGVEEGSALEP
jgi:hypothetical protein